MAEGAPIARALWVTTQDPLFLADDVDGRVLFDRAVVRMKAGPGETPVGGIGDIVMVPPVREARGRGDLTTVRPSLRMTSNGAVWPDRSALRVDAIIWCTGFTPALEHSRDRERGVEEQSGVVRVDCGGRRIIKKKKNIHTL